MPFVYPSSKFVCARCYSKTNDMALISIALPDNRPIEYLENGVVVKSTLAKIIVCYDHAEEVIYYLTGKERKLKRLYPKDLKQKNLDSTGLFK